MGMLYIDSLSVFFILTTAIVAFAASVYSISYIRAEIEENKISIRKAGGYFYLFNLFCFTMLLVPLLNNLALVWIAITHAGIKSLEWVKMLQPNLCNRKSSGIIRMV